MNARQEEDVAALLLSESDDWMSAQLEVRGGRVVERGGEILAKFIALRREPACGVTVAERRCDRDGAVVTLQPPEVVPVRVHGLRRVALVTDRRRKEPVEGACGGRQIGVGTLGLPQGLEVACRRCDVRPHLLQQRAIVRVPVHLGGEEDQLARAVVFRHRIGPTLVDAAGDFTVGELVGRIPA